MVECLYEDIYDNPQDLLVRLNGIVSVLNRKYQEVILTELRVTKSTFLLKANVCDEAA